MPAMTQLDFFRQKSFFDKKLAVLKNQKITSDNKQTNSKIQKLSKAFCGKRYPEKTKILISFNRQIKQTPR